jgi:CheY-like chemotaxis protein
MIKNILLVEDDRGTALLVSRQLTSKGYNVHTAGNGKEALKFLDSYAVDLIITDVVMPEMDGVDLYEHVKHDPATSWIPIIIVTDKQVYKECFSALGVENFVDKSSKISDLIDKIRKIATGTGPKRLPKVLVTGGHETSVNDMVQVLKDRACLISIARNTSEILFKALFMEPRIVMMDAMFHDTVGAEEIIKALRCFGNLRYTKIITYISKQQVETGIDLSGLAFMEESIKTCQQAGAEATIGRFSKPNFLEKIAEYGI